MDEIMEKGKQKGKDDSHARRIVDAMYKSDRFSQLLGIRVVRAGEGGCTLSMKIREEMVNGFGIVHGGVTFSLADSALAFASNAYGRVSVALETSISYPAPVNVGDTLTAVAVERSLTNRIGVYYITVTNQNETVVALFKGTVYRTSKEHNLPGTSSA
jgi:acyl-CoA thioesterase